MTRTLFAAVAALTLSLAGTAMAQTTSAERATTPEHLSVAEASNTTPVDSASLHQQFMEVTGRLGADLRRMRETCMMYNNLAGRDLPYTDRLTAIMFTSPGGMFYASASLYDALQVRLTVQSCNRLLGRQTPTSVADGNEVPY